MTDRETERTRAVVRQYFERMGEREWAGFGDLLDVDVRYELPQTNELITGRERLVQFNQEYPGDWSFEVTRLIADGTTAAGSMNFKAGAEEMVGLVYFEVADGLITRVTDFWPEQYEPPPGREHLVERGPNGLDRFTADD